MAGTIRQRSASAYVRSAAGQCWCMTVCQRRAVTCAALSASERIYSWMQWTYMWRACLPPAEALQAKSRYVLSSMPSFGSWWQIHSTNQSNQPTFPVFRAVDRQSLWLRTLSVTWNKLYSMLFCPSEIFADKIYMHLSKEEDDSQVGGSWTISAITGKIAFTSNEPVPKNLPQSSQHRTSWYICRTLQGTDDHIASYRMSTPFQLFVVHKSQCLKDCSSKALLSKALLYNAQMCLTQEGHYTQSAPLIQAKQESLTSASGLAQNIVRCWAVCSQTACRHQ